MARAPTRGSPPTRGPVGTPAVAVRSLIAVGTPSSGPAAVARPRRVERPRGVPGALGGEHGERPELGAQASPPGAGRGRRRRGRGRPRDGSPRRSRARSARAGRSRAAIMPAAQESPVAPLAPVRRRSPRGRAATAGRRRRRRPAAASAGRGARWAWCAAASPSSASSLSAFLWLHRAQQATQFSQVCVPPRLRGTTWSMVSALPAAVGAPEAVAVHQRGAGQRDAGPVGDADVDPEPDHGGDVDGAGRGVQHQPGGVAVDDVGLAADEQDDRAAQRQRGEGFVRGVEEQDPTAAPGGGGDFGRTVTVTSSPASGGAGGVQGNGSAGGDRDRARPDRRWARAPRSRGPR